MRNLQEPAERKHLFIIQFDLLGLHTAISLPLVVLYPQHKIGTWAGVLAQRVKKIPAIQTITEFGSPQSEKKLKT